MPEYCFTKALMQNVNSLDLVTQLILSKKVKICVQYCEGKISEKYFFWINSRWLDFIQALDAWVPVS